MPVAAIVARGEAEIGLQQISELLPVPGIDFVGPLPVEIQKITLFSAGIAEGAKEPDAARALIKFLASPAASLITGVTLPVDAGKLGPIALLRLDGDWYESTRFCLEHLYSNLSPGGVIIMDDYWAWEGCRKATDEYRETNRISAPIQRIDAAAGYWIKD